MANSLDQFIAGIVQNSPDVSDIHIREDLTSRYRLDGDIVNTDLVPDARMIESWMKSVRSDLRETDLLTYMNNISDESGGDKSGIDFSTSISGTRFRGNLSLSNNKKLSLVLRQLNSKIPDMDTLGLPSEYTAAIGKSNGLCLITGATGSGKSTTLASSLQHIANTRSGNIITIEDPVEYVLKENLSMISQKEVGSDVPTFAAAMRASLRQDPDVIMIGEIRDSVTMKAAMTMAETGHLVFATLHTNGAISTVERCVSFFQAEEKDVARLALASTLNFVLSQSLVKKKDTPGRIMVYDFMMLTSSIKTNITENNINHILNYMETNSQEGQVLMHKMLHKLVFEGKVNREDALAATNNFNKLKEALDQ